MSLKKCKTSYNPPFFHDGPIVLLLLYNSTRSVQTEKKFENIGCIVYRKLLLLI